MLVTILGELFIEINGKIYEYNPIEISNTINGRDIDKRYLIGIEGICDLPQGATIEIYLSLKNHTPRVNKETGEKLFALSFEENSLKLSLGVEGDIPGLIYRSTHHGIYICVHDKIFVDSFKIAVAWVHSNSYFDDGTLTWLAADPNYKI